MRTTSLRFKLIAWNLAVLAIAIIAVSGAQSYHMIGQLERDIDRGLETTGSEAARLGPPGRGMGRGMGRGGPGDMGGQHPPMMPGGEEVGGGRGPGGPGGPQGMNGQMGPPPMMLSDLRRPRFFDSSGVGVGPSRGQEPIDPEALRRALTGWRGFTNVGDVRVFSIEWREGGEQRGAIQVGHELRDLHLLRQGQLHNLVFLLPAALLLAGIGAYFLAQRALLPIAALTKTAKQIGASDLSQRIKVEGDDEFAELGRTFNDMIARLESSFGQLRSAYDELEAAYDKQKQFTADASHELRTPLTRLKLATSSALASDSSMAEYRQAVEVADAAGLAMAKLIDQLLVLAEADSGSLAVKDGVVDLRLVASDAVTNFPTDRKIEVNFSQDAVPVLGDSELLGRVATNLIENAVRYSTDAIRVSVSTRGTEALLRVEDFGEGISQEHLPRLFDRFYRVDVARTRSAGGTGLGLAICKSIVEAHNGRIEVSSEPGKGTTFNIFLPIFEKVANQITPK